ncbi:APC family permease [Geobacter argillaceus]|uniref:Amino acid/polyamine/organocation transporter (APC superfamily) n=1 Tax=Geobacter argillaceus TaxID=345631 RepID=A0A562WT51_9BACT|nr:APC family permease [Geobacter argillaceus]TWJ33590.1 amino acid/polyamine/organocation transporter (APC superfamily) [Geobacter argillaceus]
MELEKNGNGNLLQKIVRTIFGAPKYLKDPHLFHKMSLIPILAWVGLGADGLSSSAYGPEEAFRALGSHTYLAILLGLTTALTVFIISYAYSRIIEHFPHGGGGYIVATHMLGEKAGVVSGSSLLVDYVLTITVSIASCVDALFSYVPQHYHHYKVPFACVLALGLIILNIRGVKESITVMAPIFLIFVLTHLLMLLDGIITHTDRIAPLTSDFQTGLHHDLSTIGLFGILLLFLRAYSLGGGTYTGIEAVSNGLQIMREPRVQTGKRTMIYMATSLAFTAGVLFLCYALIGVKPVEGKTLNAVLADGLFANWPFGNIIAFITIFSEGALLLVAAQTGFVDGPRVMANMAVDSWFPHRFAALSVRLTMRNGIVLMGVSSIALLLYTKGSVSALVVMYSINVFVTFSLSQLGMSRFFIQRRKEDPKWLQHLAVHLVGLVLCVTILVITTVEKFTEGGWLTLLITSLVIGLCYLIKGHYQRVRQGMAELDETLLDFPTHGPINMDPLQKNEPTAIQLVSGYSGFGVHTLLSILTTFPKTYKNIIFVSVAMIDSGTFKGAEEMQSLEESVKYGLERYTNLARRLGFAADYRMTLGTEVVESAVDLCEKLAEEYPRSTVFTGQLTFRLEKFYHKMLHNETAFAIQRRLQWNGLTTVILPIRVRI